MNIIKKELKFNRISLLIWSIAIFLLLYMGMTEFKAGTVDGGLAYQEMIDKMPRAVKALFGMSDFDLGTLIGYFSMMQLYIIILASIHAGMLGVNIVLKEENKKTAEFLMVKPLKRQAILTYKIIASLIIIFILNILITLSSIVSILSFSDFGKTFGKILLLEVGLFFIQLLFLGAGILFATAFKKINKPSSYITITILGFYFIQFFSNFFEQLNFLSYLNPLQFFNINNQSYIWILQIIFIIIAVIVFYYISKKKYLEKDF